MEQNYSIISKVHAYLNLKIYTFQIPLIFWLSVLDFPLLVRRIENPIKSLFK